MRHLMFFLFTAAFVVGCGGGGSSSSPTPAASDPGTLTLLLGDSPADDFDEVLLTIDGVRLLGDVDHVVELAEPVMVDLLQLRNLTELLAQSEVPAGTYSKIRLEISDLQLNTLDDDGQVVTQQRPPLPANGRIDLNPRGEFALAAGGELVIEIDIDVEKSFKVTSTGNGEYRFRPVVFIDVLVNDDEGRLSRLSGAIMNLDGNRFDLCDDDEDECVPVVLGAGAPLMNSVGEAVESGALADNLEVTLFGHFVEDSASEGKVLEALALAIVAEDELEDVEGLVEALPVEGAFNLLDDDDEDVTPVELIAGALVLDANDAMADSSILVAGVEVEGWGLEIAGSELVRLLVVKLEEADDDDDSDDVEGSYSALDGDTLTLIDDDSNQLCVVLSADTVIFEVLDDDNNADSMELNLEQFVANADSGRYSAGATPRFEFEAEGVMSADCLVADTLIIESDDD